MPKTGSDVKKYLLVLLAIPAIVYAGMLLFVFIFPTSYGRCDHYNEKLNGVTVEYEGRPYTVNLCGTGGNDNSNNDEIRLQVFNENGDLLALRHFVVNWNENNFPRKIEYRPDRIIYYDGSLESDYKKAVSMPPTALDWVRARIPFFD